MKECRMHQGRTSPERVQHAVRKCNGNCQSGSVSVIIITHRRTGAARIDVNGSPLCFNVVYMHRPEIDAVPRNVGGVGQCLMQLRAGKQDAAPGRGHGCALTVLERFLS